jgi:uncharacterized protein YfkK (UPF0435 family)
MRKKPIIHISSDNQTFLHCNLVNPLALEDREARCFKLRVQLVEICKKFRALKLIVINPKKFQISISRRFIDITEMFQKKHSKRFSQEHCKPVYT